MSIDHCKKCGDLVDTDYRDDCYEDAEGNPRDHYLCGECEEALKVTAGSMKGLHFTITANDTGLSIDGKQLPGGDLPLAVAITRLEAACRLARKETGPPDPVAARVSQRA